MKNNLIIEIAGISDVGCTREHNEDFIAWDNDLGLIVLADGMGGHNAGEVASKMAVENIINNIKGSFGFFAETDDEILDEDIVSMSLEAISEANYSIFNSASQHPEYKGMGTTLVMALFNGKSVTISHVGDSRLYRYRDSQFEQLTTDHSLYQEMITGGYMTEEEAGQSLNKNMITRALGINDEVEVDVQQQDVQEGDVFLLCSDGLTDLLNDEEISSSIVSSSGDIKSAAETLVNQANDKGGLDNISVILMNVVPIFEKDAISS